MALATRTISGNNSGALLRMPKVVVMHATRSGRVSYTDAQELGSTINWFLNPAGASAHWILSKRERVRAVSDTLIAWHSARLNPLSWAIEFTQPTIDRTFGTGHYANAALIGRHYVAQGVAPVWLDYWDGNLIQSGFVDHEDTIQGRESGKSDIGYRFDRPRFIDSLEVPMNDEEFNRRFLKAIETVGYRQRDDSGAETGPKRTVANWTWRLRQLIETLEASDYTDAKAVKAVRDKL